jgi:ribosomal protein S19E (S16A)
MADAKGEEFDANDRILGFSLLSIKRALQWVGMMEDRDDIDYVAEALGCPEQQALRVLEELEHRGLVTKAQKKRQWVTTPKGHRLALYWHPPRVLRPAIEYEAGPGSINEQFEAVPCSIWRHTPDEEEMFEEGEIDVGVHVDYDTDRLIEINISQIDEYQGESNGSSVCERSVYISATDARTLLEGLQKAIAGAEEESARRVARRARLLKRKEAKNLRRAKKEDERLAQLAADESEPRASDSAKADTATMTTKASPKRRPDIQRVSVPPSATAPQAEEVAPSGKAVAAALAEIREANRARRMAARKASDKPDV